jgi:DNA-binding NtrC family response regulator
MSLFDNPLQGPKADSARVAVLDDDTAWLLVVKSVLACAGYQVLAMTEPSSFLSAVTESPPDAICLDLHLPGHEGMSMLEAVRRASPDTPVIMLTADDRAASVVGAMRAGAYDYVTKAIDHERLLLTVEHAVSERRLALRVASLERPDGGRRFGGVWGRSAAMQEVFRQLDGISTSDVPVLLHGESGVGKARLARAIHDHGRRRNRPFIELNLSTTPDQLQAPTLFGYSRGTVPGAVASRRGLLDQVMGGTLFLRDLAELGPVAQAGLLRVLERGAFLRVGGRDEVPCDLRLLASTARDVGAEVAARRFREALYFRIAVFDLRMPSLRERVEDIVPLAVELLREHSAVVEPSRTVAPLSLDAVDALRVYRWPGNVRELSNAMQRALIAAGSRSVSVADLPAIVRESTPADEAVPSADNRESAGESLAVMERRAILASLARHAGNTAAASRELGIGRATLYRKMKELTMGAGAPGS